MHLSEIDRSHQLILRNAIYCTKTKRESVHTQEEST